MSNVLWKKLAKLVSASVLITLTLTGCGTMMGIVGINDICNRENPDEGLIRPTYWSSSWPDAAIVEAKERNSDFESVCF